MIRGEPRYATDWGFAPARHEGFPVDAARRLGMIPVVSVPGVHNDLLRCALAKPALGKSSAIARTPSVLAIQPEIDDFWRQKPVTTPFGGRSGQRAKRAVNRRPTGSFGPLGRRMLHPIHRISGE